MPTFSNSAWQKGLKSGGGSSFCVIGMIVFDIEVATVQECLSWCGLLLSLQGLLLHSGYPLELQQAPMLMLRENPSFFLRLTFKVAGLQTGLKLDWVSS